MLDPERFLCPKKYFVFKEIFCVKKNCVNKYFVSLQNVVRAAATNPLLDQTKY